MTEFVNEVAAVVVSKLKAAGFKIQRYDSYTTNSVYLKLDYGVAHSIRISDHDGKKHLQYRYNVLTDRVMIHRGFKHGALPRFYYGPLHLERLVEDILQARRGKMSVYGESKYRRWMEESKVDNRERKGFWAQCIEV